MCVCVDVVSKHTTHLVATEDVVNNPDDVPTGQAITVGAFAVRAEWVRTSSERAERQEESRFAFEATQHQARFDGLLREATLNTLTLPMLEKIEKVTQTIRHMHTPNIIM